MRVLDDLRLAWRFALASRSRFTGRIALTSTLAAVALLLGCVGLSIAQGFAHVRDVSQARSWDIVDSRDQAVAIIRRDVVQLNRQSIEILKVAPLRAGSVEFPGLRRLPPPGEYAVSPAVRDLVEGSPSMQALMPVAQVIGSEGVASGAERFAVRRVSPATIAGGEEVWVSGFGHSLPQEPSTVAVVPTWAPVVAVLLLLGLPMVLLLSTASRLAAAVREHRILLMSKLGARRRASSVAVLESLLLMAPGLLVGAILWLAGSPRLGHVPFVGSPLLEGAWRWTPAHWLVLAAALITIAVSTRAVARPRRVATTHEAEPVSPARTSLFVLGVALLLVTPWLSSADRPRLYLVAVCVAALGVAVALPYWLRSAGHGMRANRRTLPFFVAGSRLARFPKRHARGWAALAVACAIFSPALVMAELNAQGDTDEREGSTPELALYKVELTDPQSDISQLSAALAPQYVGWLHLTGDEVGIAGTCRDVATAVDAKDCPELSRMLSTVVPWAGQIRFVGDGPPPRQRLAVIISSPGSDTLSAIAAAESQAPLSSVTELTRNEVKASPLVPWIMGGIAVAIGAAMLAILVLVVDRSMIARQADTLSRIGLSLRKRRLIDAVTFVTACWVSAGAGLGLGVLAAVVLSRDEFAGLFPWQGLTAMVGLVLALSVIGAVAVAVGSARATTASSGRR